MQCTAHVTAHLYLLCMCHSVVFNNCTEREVKRGNPTPFSYILYFFMTFINNTPEAGNPKDTSIYYHTCFDRKVSIQCASSVPSCDPYYHIASSVTWRHMFCCRYVIVTSHESQSLALLHSRAAPGRRCAPETPCSLKGHSPGNASNIYNCGDF